MSAQRANENGYTYVFITLYDNWPSNILATIIRLLRRKRIRLRILVLPG